MLLKLVKLCIFCLVLTGTTEFLFASGIKNKQFPSEYSKTNILKFCDYLVKKQEFYRASVELQRYKNYYNYDLITKQVIITETLLNYYNLNLYSEYNKNPDRNWMNIEKVVLCDDFINRKLYYKIESLINSDEFENTTGLEKSLLEKRLLIYNIIVGRNVYKISNKFYKYESKKLDYLDKQKSPFLGLLSGVVPGMGYYYADQKATGIVAFVLIAALSTVSYYAYKTENKTISIFCGSISGLFYGGSIIGGYLQTKKYNEILENDLIRVLGEELNLKKDREDIYKKFGIGNLYE